MIMKNIYHLFLSILLIGAHSCVFAKSSDTLDGKAVAPAIEIFVKDLQCELHMESYSIPVKGLSDKNAMVVSIPFSGHYKMYINEEWFNSLSVDGRRFLVGHELMHIKHKHIQKSVLLSLAFPSLSARLLFPLWGKKKGPSNAFEAMLTLWYSRRNEKEADISCAKRLHCANGGIEVFTSLETSPDKRLFKVPDAFLDHPSHKVRIEYLQELAESEKYQNSCYAYATF